MLRTASTTLNELGDMVNAMSLEVERGVGIQEAFERIFIREVDTDYHVVNDDEEAEEDEDDTKDEEKLL